MKQNNSAFSRFQDFLETQKGQTILNYLYSWGAAVVILGALFKLTHISGADLMLFLGMGTEVLTFIVNGFERQSSAKETEAPAAAGGPVIIGGGAPVAAGTVVSAPVVNVAPATATSAGAAPQLDTEALTAMANIATANAAVAAASAPQIDTEALNAMANIAAAANAATVSTASASVPVIDGKVDVPELQQVTQDYIEQLRALTESFEHIATQSSQLEASADEIERLVHPTADFLGRNAEVFGAEGDVLLDDGGNELVIGVLEDHADPSAKLIEVLLGHILARDVAAVDQNLTRGRL